MLEYDPNKHRDLRGNIPADDTAPGPGLPARRWAEETPRPGLPSDALGARKTQGGSRRIAGDTRGQAGLG